MSGRRDHRARVVPLRRASERADGEETQREEEQRMFTRHSLAAYLRVHVNTVDRLVKRGELPVYRIAGRRRFRAEDIERYVQDHREAG
jgi:excisionase family DNA binding protein